MARQEIRISGFGGQGIILMGYIIGKAASIHDGKYATLTQSYGPEARGGACSAQVIISETKISYPLLISPHFLIVMSQAAYNTYRSGLRQDGIMIYDSLLVTPEANDPIQAFKIPSKKIAMDIGRQIIANMVMLGFFTKITGLVSRSSMEQSISSSVSEEMLAMNMEAFHRGFDYNE